MYYVYILKSLKSGKYYIGHTNNYLRRFKEHNSAKKGYTKRHKPFAWVKIWKTDSRKKAMTFEKKLKDMKGGNTFNALVDG